MPLYFDQTKYKSAMALVEASTCTEASSATTANPVKTSLRLLAIPKAFYSCPSTI
jgi:hypothetical protein